MGPMTCGGKTTFRMATHSWMFWHPVSMEIVLLHLKRGKSLVISFDITLFEVDTQMHFFLLQLEEIT